MTQLTPYQIYDLLNRQRPLWLVKIDLSDASLWLVDLRHPSPMSLPLMVERFREKLTTEQLSTRLDRILRDMERDTP